ALRTGFASVSLVAEDQSGILGHILFSRLEVRDAGRPLTGFVALAPLAVLPERQGRGIGSRLVRGGLEACRQRGERVVVVLGDPAYYGRFGFRGELAARLESVYAPAHWMALELTAGALFDVRARLEYPAPFASL